MPKSLTPPTSKVSAMHASIRTALPSSAVEWVSSVSRWTDRKWVFDGKAVGANSSTVTCIWDFEFPDGSTLFDTQHSRLLYEARHFMWSLYGDRREGRRLKPSAAGGIFSGLRRLLLWMVENNYASFSELNGRASDRFGEWLADFYARPRMEAEGEHEVNDDKVNNLLENPTTEDEIHSNTEKLKPIPQVEEEFDFEDIAGVTIGAFSHSLRVWRYLWEQRFALSRVGIKSMGEAPFSGRSIQKIAAELATKTATRIPHIPDVVAIPLMNAAHEFIASTADDLIMAMNELFSVRKILPEGEDFSLQEYAQMTEVLANIQFSGFNETGRPWHHPLGSMGTSAFEELRKLVDDLVNACTIVAQSESGMRIGELAAIRSGVDEKTGLPLCITVRTSKSGMLDLYYLKSTLTKLRPAPVQEEWLLGAAPRGTKELPDAVRAIVVLQQVLAPLRAIAEPSVAQYLLVTIGVPRGLPGCASSVTGPNSHVLRLGQKFFARSFVDWTEVELTEETRPYIETRGNCIRTHQWRKNYAKYVFQVDKKMLAAIARQFKHLSLAMTEGAYVGTSTSLVLGVAEFNRNLTTDMFLSNIRGTAPKQEGRLAKLMAQYQPELSKIVEGLNDSEARLAVDAWCRNRDMKIFFHGYGKCVPAVAPMKAECHKRAHTVHWANKAPNFATREPTVCTGCFLFLADEDSIDHWTRRYVENLTSWRRANAEGRGNEYRVAKTRADQAKGYLLTLGAPVPLLETTDAG